MTMQGAEIENRDMHRRRLERNSDTIIQLLNELLAEIKELNRGMQNSGTTQK